MARFVKGDVVVVPFPFSDLSEAKRRPALVVADLTGDDLILCQITSQHIKDTYSISLDEKHFKSCRLNMASNTRPNRIFTAYTNIILYKAGHLQKKKITEVIEKIIDIFNG